MRFLPVLTRYDEGLDRPFAYNGPFGTDLRGLPPLEQVAWRLETDLQDAIGVPQNDAWICQVVADMAFAVGLHIQEVPSDWGRYRPLTQGHLGDLELALQEDDAEEVRGVLASWARSMGLLV
jgi:hypothetical protein